MHCSDIAVFRILRDLGYPVFPVVDLHFYPDPKEFLEIIGMNMPVDTDEFSLFEIAVKHLMQHYIGMKSPNSQQNGVY